MTVNMNGNATHSLVLLCFSGFFFFLISYKISRFFPPPRLVTLMLEYIPSSFLLRKPSYLFKGLFSVSVSDRQFSVFETMQSHLLLVRTHLIKGS